MAIVLNGTSGITNDSGYTGDGVSFADSTPANTLVTTSGGNVGIGTSSPSGAKVQIVGDNSALRVGDGTRDMYVDPDSGGIFLSNASGQSGEGFYLASSGNTLRMYTSSTERARIDSSGNLLVGRTTNASTAARAAFDGGGAFNAISCIRAGTGFQTQIEFFNPNGGVGFIATNGTGTSYATSSDYRLKHDIQPMTGALARVAALKPVTYKWNADNSQDEGFIAHELAEVCPSAVSGEKDAVDAEGKPVYQGIDTSFLVATLTAAIQEQQALIESLTARVVALEGQAT